MPAALLTLLEREEIRAGIERQESLTSVASRLDRHRCTISAEVARNGGRSGYRAVGAHQSAQLCRARPKVPCLISSPGLVAHVEARLRARDSPMTIAVELTADLFPDIEGTVSHETIYRAVYGHGQHGLPIRAVAVSR